MCFSTTASFGAAAVLAVGGVISLKKVTDRSQLMFAAIPLLFAIQQVSEGFLWLALTHDSFRYLQTAVTYIFLFFAQMLWTTWIPISMLLIEKNAVRKKLLYFTSAAGIITSCILAYRLIFYTVYAEISGHHIYYFIESPKMLMIISSVLYVVAIILPPFISGVKGMTTLGILEVAALLVTKFFYEQYLISVWCFFAAVFSIMIVSIMQNFQRESLQVKSRTGIGIKV